MPQDESERTSPPENRLVIIETPGMPAVAQIESLIAGLRTLQTLIPGFTQLSIDEQRSMARAAYLDPEFVTTGIQAAEVWPQTRTMTGRSGEELREEQEEIRRWEEVERELQALTRGVAAANLKRKHRLGKAILRIYSILGAFDRRPGESDAYLRPYYENMKRAYRRSQGKRRGKTGEP